MKEYIAEVMSLAQKLKAMDKEVNDELLATILLQGLTKQYIPIRVAIETCNITLTADYVKTKLLTIEEEDCNSEQKPSDCLDVTFGESVTLYCDKDGKSSKPRKNRGVFQATNRTNLLADSGDYAYVRERGNNYPCFMIWVRILLWGLAKVFEYW